MIVRMRMLLERNIGVSLSHLALMVEMTRFVSDRAMLAIEGLIKAIDVLLIGSNEEKFSKNKAKLPHKLSPFSLAWWPLVDGGVRILLMNSIDSTRFFSAWRRGVIWWGFFFFKYFIYVVVIFNFSTKHMWLFC